MNLKSKAVVKCVLSGDSIVLREKPVNGPPPEKIVSLAYIVSPHGSKNSFDEPFSFEAREALRKRLVGKEVEYSVVFSRNGRDTVYIEGVAEYLLSLGLAQLRPKSISEDNMDLFNQLQVIEAKAKDEGIGIWSSDPDRINQASHVISNVDDLSDFVHQNKAQQLSAIIEQVRDASSLRVLILPLFKTVTLYVSGIKAPAVRQGIPNVPDLVEPFGEEAKFFVESRLLQREVKIIVEGLVGNGVIGSVIHPAGNIAVALVSSGLATVLDSSIAVVSSGPIALREAEKKAQNAKLKIWNNYVPQVKNYQTFVGTVVKIFSGDTIVVEKPDGSEHKITFSSIRPPKKDDAYYLLECKEYLRKKLIGNKVDVSIEYTKPSTDEFEEKVCGSVFIDNQINVAEALLNKGLALVIYHKKEDLDRSAHYDQLLQAHEKSSKEKKGLHSGKQIEMPRIVDASESAAKARSFLPSFKRSGKIPAVVEHVMNGNCMKLFIKKENVKIVFYLGCIRTPRFAKAGSKAKDEPYAEEALKFISRKIYQRDVEIEVDNIDKNGAFIGSLFLDGKENIALSLLKEGLAYMSNFGSQDNQYFSQLVIAENFARSNDLKVWKLYNEELAKQENSVEVDDAVAEVLEVAISEILSPGHFYFQDLNNKEIHLLEQIMDELNKTTLAVKPSLKVNDLVACKFSSDGSWYRAKILTAHEDKYDVKYIDYGNTETVAKESIRILDARFSSLPAQAKEGKLSFLRCLPEDSEYYHESLEAFSKLVSKGKLKARVDMKMGGIPYLTLFDSEKVDADLKNVEMSINSEFVKLGYAQVAPTRKFQETVKVLEAMQEQARKNHSGMFEYGDYSLEEEAPL